MTAITVASWGSGAAAPEELLTAGRDLAAARRTELVWLQLGSLPPQASEIAGRYGVARIDRIADPKLEGFPADALVESLAQYARSEDPAVMLLAQTFEVRAIAPRLAGRLGSTVVMNGVALDAEAEGPLRVTASAYGGDTHVVYRLGGTGPAIIALSANAILPDPAEVPAGQPVLREVEVDLTGVEERVRVVEASRSEGPRLQDAEIIVAGGRGLGSLENYKLIEELAAALGGLAAASRPIVDEGWVDSSRQVGLTGVITAPALYIAAGISGASQHMAGCSAAKTIVAINRDADAAIFKHARFGIVGNCLEVLPELIRAVKGD